MNYELELECLDWAAEPVSRRQSQPWEHGHPTVSIPPRGPRRGIQSTRNVLGAAGGRAKETQPVLPQGSDWVHTAREGSDHSSQNLVLVGTKHNEARAALVTHVTKIVFTGLINLHLCSCEWQVFVPHMEGTLGEAVFRYLFTILWKDIQSVNFQIKFEHYNEK